MTVKLARAAPPCSPAGWGHSIHDLGSRLILANPLYSFPSGHTLFMPVQWPHSSHVVCEWVVWNDFEDVPHQIMATASIGQRSAEFSSKVSEACEAADKFVQVFYETLDKRRQVSSHFQLKPTICNTADHY